MHELYLPCAPLGPSSLHSIFVAPAGTLKLKEGELSVVAPVGPESCVGGAGATLKLRLVAAPVLCAASITRTESE